MGQVTVVDPNTLCDHCDDPILNDPKPVTANVQMHDDFEVSPHTWHEQCVPEGVLTILELEASYDRENPDG